MSFQPTFRRFQEMYVSAHDAGAFYTFDRLTGTFEFKSQETRKGILQQPNFPKTVITSDNHPVLFSAEGSHGLWATPGKHRFVRVPRLYDINGFGQPWQTWNNVEVIYNDVLGEIRFENNLKTRHLIAVSLRQTIDGRQQPQLDEVSREVGQSKDQMPSTAAHRPPRLRADRRTTRHS